MTTPTTSTTSHRPSRRLVPLLAAAAAVALSVSTAPAVMATPEATTTSSSVSAASHATDADWQRHYFAKTSVGDVSFSLPSRYSASRVDTPGHTQIYIFDELGKITLSFESRSLTNSNEVQSSTSGSASTASGQTRYGTVTEELTTPMELPWVSRNHDGTMEPVARYVTISDERGTAAGLGISSSVSGGTASRTQFVTVCPCQSNPRGPGSTSTYSFGDKREVKLNTDSDQPDDFNNVEEARAYMETDEFKQRWAIVTSLQVDQSTIQ